MADITIHTADAGDAPETVAAAERAAAETAHNVAHQAVQHHIGDALTDAHDAALSAMDSANTAEKHAENTAKETGDDSTALMVAGFATMNESLQKLLDLQTQSKEAKKEEDEALETVDPSGPISGESENGGPDVNGATTAGAKGDPGTDSDPGSEEESEKDNAKKAKRVAAKDIQPKRRAGWRQRMLGSSGGLK